MFLILTHAVSGLPALVNMDNVNCALPMPDGGTELHFAGGSVTCVRESQSQVSGAVEARQPRRRAGPTGGLSAKVAQLRVAGRRLFDALDAARNGVHQPVRFGAALDAWDKIDSNREGRA